MCLEETLDDGVVRKFWSNIMYYFIYFTLTFLFGVSLRLFRALNCAHIFNNNMFLKSSKYGHGAAPKSVLSLALPSTKACNYSSLWHHQAIPSSFWYSPTKDTESAALHGDKYVRHQYWDPEKQPEVLMGKWQSDTVAITVRSIISLSMFYNFYVSNLNNQVTRPHLSYNMKFKKPLKCSSNLTNKSRGKY